MFAEVRDSTATTGVYFCSSGKPIRGAMARESDRVPQNLRSDHVEILCLPPHTTHRLQPFDVAFMRPLMLNYDEAVRIWLRSHLGRVVSIYAIAKLFGSAYLKAATVNTAVNAFKSTGIVPYNPDIFSDADFAGADPTDLEMPGNSLNATHDSTHEQENQSTPTTRNSPVT